MTALETSSYRMEDARSALWFGRWPGGWGDVVHGVAPGKTEDQLTPSEAAQRREYAARAIRALTRAVEQGYSDKAELESDWTLDAIRANKDYQKFLAQLKSRR